MIIDWILYFGWWAYFLLLSGCAIYLAEKNKHKIVMWVLIGWLVLGISNYSFYPTIPPFLYLFFLLVRWIGRKFSKKKKIVS